MPWTLPHAPAPSAMPRSQSRSSTRARGDRTPVAKSAGALCSGLTPPRTRTRRLPIGMLIATSATRPGDSGTSACVKRRLRRMAELARVVVKPNMRFSFLTMSTEEACRNGLRAMGASEGGTVAIDSSSGFAIMATPLPSRSCALTAIWRKPSAAVVPTLDP